MSGFSRTFSRRTFLYTGVAALVVRGGRLQAAQTNARITTTDLGGATLLQGAGGNVIALPGPDGALMIDGGRAANANALIEAVKTATRSTRINTLVDTHWHPDQTGANEAVGKSGGVIFAHEKTKTLLSNTVYSAIGLTSRVPPLAKKGRPTKTRSGRCSITRTAHGWAAACARWSDSRRLSNPTPASCPRPAG